MKKKSNYLTNTIGFLLTEFISYENTIKEKIEGEI